MPVSFYRLSIFLAVGARDGGCCLSDYPTERKLKALNMETVLSFSSLDSCIDRLKPDPKGLLHICRCWKLLPGECLVIGDRDDRDGEAARRAGMNYIIVPHGLKFSNVNQLFDRITSA